ncbi:MAG: hypothetical protein ACM3ZR_03150 [Pseudomonadota bacterium]
MIMFGMLIIAIMDSKKK